MINKKLEKFENILGIKFKNEELLELALTHKSYGVTSGKGQWNERLEFLGDSILSSVISDYLYNKFSEVDEGILSKMKSYLVSRVMLLKWAKKIFISDYILLSKNEEKAGGRQKERIIVNAYEALIGAIHLDSGYDAVKKFIFSNLEEEDLGKLLNNLYQTDYKSKLQEIIQKKYKVLPVYKVINETGPSHEKEFEIAVKLKNKIIGVGKGKNKKDAEQEAAKEAYNYISARK